MRLRGVEDSERRAPGAIELPEGPGVGAIEVDLPPSSARELKLWAHAITPEGFSARLPMRITVEEQELAIDGEAVVPIVGEVGLRIALSGDAEAPAAAST